MIVGLDRSFRPEWIYKILKISKPGVKYKDLELEFFNIIEYKGLKSKKNVLTIIRRYYLQIVKNNGEEIISDNYLHGLSQKYSFDSLKPLLLFVLLSKCDIAKFLQFKINLLFRDQEKIEISILHKHARKVYGDRKVVSYATGYYLTILSYFDVLNKEKHKYSWKNRKLNVPDHILMEMIILYAGINDLIEIDVHRLREDITFSIFNLSNLESVLVNYNTKQWIYQKRFDSKKIVLSKIKLMEVK